MSALQIHQSELKQRDQQLRRTQLELARARAREEIACLYDFSLVACLLLAEDATIVRANLALCAMLGVERSNLVASKFTRFAAPEALALHRHAIADGDRKVCRLELRRADGRSFWAEMAGIQTVHPDTGLRAMLCSITDISVRKQSDDILQPNAHLYRELFERAPICLFKVELGADQGIIVDANSRAYLTYGYTDGEMRGMSLARLVSEKSRSAALDMLARVRRDLTVSEQAVHQHRDGTPFTVRVSAIVDPSTSHHVIITVEDITAEQIRHSEEAAIDAERRRMAQEIHDGVAQSLAALRLKSALWQRLVDTDPPGMHAALAELQSRLNTAIQDTRRAVYALRPMEMAELGFFAALTKWVEGYSVHNQLPIQLQISGSPEKLPEGYELPLFRLIQQAVNNVKQHARAGVARIQLGVDADGGVALSVSDDGQGFDIAKHCMPAHGLHFGLPQMRERVFELGGTMHVRSKLGRGTAVLIHLPPGAGVKGTYKGIERRGVAKRGRKH